MSTENVGLDYGNVLLTHNMSVLKSRKDANTKVTRNGKIFDMPVVLSNMPCCQNDEILYTFDQMKWPYVYHRLGGYKDMMEFVEWINDQDWHLKSISVGTSEEDRLFLKNLKLQKYELDWLTIDVALVFNDHFGDYIKWVRDMFPDVYLIAGNFSTPESIQWLGELGVNCGKFGIGVSELCRTRQYTGFGSTTISDLIACVQGSPFDMDLMSDGGLRILDREAGEIAFGDIFKALNFGADWVMSSSLFRYVTELADTDGWIEQYGNSTFRAKGYNSNVEGATKRYKTNGQTLVERMAQIKDNLQSSISYAGIRDVNDAYLSCEYKII